MNNEILEVRFDARFNLKEAAEIEALAFDLGYYNVSSFVEELIRDGVEIWKGKITHFENEFEKEIQSAIKDSHSPKRNVHEDSSIREQKSRGRGDPIREIGVGQSSAGFFGVYSNL